MSKSPRTAGVALTGLAAITVATATPFWRMEEGAEREAALEQFMKNLSLLGGAMLAATAGHSAGHVKRKKARKAKAHDKAKAKKAAAKSGASPVPRPSERYVGMTGVPPSGDSSSEGIGPGQVWAAPVSSPLHGSAPLDATVDVPGSKSLTNRYLVLAALADAPVVVRGGLVSRDSDLMIAALRSLGVVIDSGVNSSGDGSWTVTPGVLRGGVHVDCGLAGTVMRFVPPLTLLAGIAGDRTPVTFDGDAGARLRPMGPLLDALRALGATVDDDGRGTLPFTVVPPDFGPRLGRGRLVCVVPVRHGAAARGAAPTRRTHGAPRGRDPPEPAPHRHDV